MLRESGLNITNYFEDRDSVLVSDVEQYIEQSLDLAIFSDEEPLGEDIVLLLGLPDLLTDDALDIVHLKNTSIVLYLEEHQN
jgi:hypothetical protein